MRSARLIFLTLAALAAGLSEQSARLELGKSIPGDISEGRSGVYPLTLAADQYLRVVLTQSSGPVGIELYAPDGMKLVEIDTRNFAGQSRIVWVAKTTGEYRIGVSGAGRYEIKLEELRKASAADHKRVEAEGLFSQGISRARNSDYDQAVLSFTRAAGLYREDKDHERECDALNAAGAMSYNLHKTEKAIGYFKQALSISREIKNRRSEGGALENLGQAYQSLGQYHKAIGWSEEALGITREIGDHRVEARILNNLGNAYRSLSEYENAIVYADQTLTISREIKDRRVEGWALINLGAAYLDLGQAGKGIGYLESALAIEREFKNRIAEGGILNNLGNAFKILDQYEKAIEYYNGALVIEREIGDRRNEGVTLSNLGGAYCALGQCEKALGYYEQGRSIARENRNREGEGMALVNIASAYNYLGQYEKAIGFEEKALSQAAEDRIVEGYSLGLLGRSYRLLGKGQKAIGYYERALTLARNAKVLWGEGLLLNELGSAYLLLGRYDTAARNYVSALAASRTVKDRRTEADELSGLMNTFQAAGNARLAIFYGKQAVNTLQSIRSDNSGLSQDLQRSFLQVSEKPYHKLSEILIAQGRLLEAEQVLALLKEEEFFQYIRRDGNEASSLSRRADLTPEEAEYEKRYREIGDQLMSIGSERGELLAKKTLTPGQSQRLAQLEKDLAVGNHAFEGFLGDLTRHFSAKPEMAGHIETLRETQGIMEDLRELPPGTVAIFTLIGDDKFHAILRTPDAQKAYEYPIKAADLNRKILEFRQVIQDPKLDPRPLAQELYNILIGGMAADLRQAKAQTLMWSLDGALRYVPLAAIYDGKQYLIEQYRVSVMTLASNTRLKELPGQVWKAAAFGVTKGYEDAPALPSVSAELTGIVKILGGEMQLDDQFTQQSMRQTLLKHYPVVHIASHFRFQPGNDTKSFLLLGDGGHLSLAELKISANLFGGVQLLTLSACNTGVGDGAEVEGFGTLAQRQGAKAVVASLWPVADESTSLLMQEFYRIRESSAGMTKLEALREAQLRLLRGDVQFKGPSEDDRGVVANRPTSGSQRLRLDARAPYAHPYYWAPFFLMGNWL